MNRYCNKIINIFNNKSNKVINSSYSKSIINNTSSIYFINNSNKYDYTTTSTTSYHGFNNSYNLIGIDSNSGYSIYKDANQKSIDFDIERTLQLVNSNIHQIQNGSISNEVLINYKKILECKQDQLKLADRYMCAKLLMKIELAKCNNDIVKIDKQIIDKFIKLIEIEDYKFLDKDLDSTIHHLVLIEKLQFPFYTNHSISSLYQPVLDSVKIIQSVDSGTLQSDTIQRLAISSYYAAAVLGMWKELVFLREKLSGNNINFTIDSALRMKNVLDVESIYEIITNKVQHSILSSPFYDITQDSTPPDKDLKSLQLYGFNTYGFKNFTFDNINMEENEFKLKQKEFFLRRNLALKLQAKDENGYALFGNDGTVLLFIGRVAKLIISNGMKYGGITDKEFTKLHLYGTARAPNGDTLNAQYNFDINSSENNSITLTGSHRNVHESKDGKKVIIANDVFVNATLSQL